MKALGLVVSDKKIFENCILKTYFLTPWPIYATNWNGLNNFDRGPPRDHSCEVLSKSNKRFQRRCCLKKLLMDARMDDGHRTLKDHKSSLSTLCSGELKNQQTAMAKTFENIFKQNWCINNPLVTPSEMTFGAPKGVNSCFLSHNVIWANQLLYRYKCSVNTFILALCTVLEKCPVYHEAESPLPDSWVSRLLWLIQSSLRNLVLQILKRP